MPGGSANGERLACEGSMGECTAVASAKRGVLGVFRDGTDDEFDDVRDRVATNGSVFVSAAV